MDSAWILSSAHGNTLNVGHRGSSAVAPQNTLSAFERAADMGADGIEFDVHLSADGVPVVIHDFTVDATTNGSGSVAQMTLQDLQELDAGTSFSPEFAGEHIPTLAQVLEDLQARDILFNIEIKTAGPRNTGLEQATVEQVRKYHLEERVLFSSFNPISLWRIKQIAPDMPIGFLYSTKLRLPTTMAWIALIFPHEARHPEHTLVDGKCVARARRRGYQINTWEVNDPEEMQRLVALGVNSIITNVPDVLRGILEAAREHKTP